MCPVMVGDLDLESYIRIKVSPLSITALQLTSILMVYAVAGV